MSLRRLVCSLTLVASFFGFGAACHTNSAAKSCAEHKASTEVVVIAYAQQDWAFCRYARTYDSTVQRCAWVRFSDHHVSQDPHCTGV